MGTNLDIDNPVFVIGTGRSGLSPLMDLIAYHKIFAWLCQYNVKFPAYYGVSFLRRIVDLPIFNSKLKFKKVVPKPAEAFPFWNQHFRGFGRPFRDLVEDDVTPLVRRRIRHAVSEVMRFQAKDRFIAEYSGWSRISFMKSIFPNAKFIHIIRDGRAVANSLINVGWWNGWEGIHKWRWGVPEPCMLEKLEKYSYSFLALAAVQWKILVRNILEKSKLLKKEDLLLVRYEDLVKNPYEIASQCLDFLGVDKNCKRFKKHLSTVKIVDANNNKFRIPAWKDNMTKKQIAMLNDVLEDELVYLNYLIGLP